MQSNPPFARPLTRRLLLAAAAAVVAGCAPARVPDPLTRSLPGSGPEVQGEFWYQLARRPLTSNDDAFHALLLYADGADPAGTYGARVAVLEGRHLLPAGFAGRADDAVDRGTLAVALDGLLHVRGGLTMRLFGPSPRYALRAAVDRGLFPPSSPNQAISGGAFVGVMQKAEELERGDPSDGPADQLPDQVHPVAPAVAVAVAVAVAAAPAPPPPPPVDWPPVPPIYLDEVAAALAAPTTAPADAAAAAGPVHLRAIVLAVQGELVEIRPDPAAAWKRARPGMVLREGTEIRTGPKSAVRFIIPADEAFCLDSQGDVVLQQAVVDLRRARTRLGLAYGRVREDLSHTPIAIEAAGLEHDTVIQSPNAALALRGTKVSLCEQPSFAPVAISLTGRATFTNTAGRRVAFGAAGRRHVVIVGDQTAAAQQAAAGEAALSGGGNTARLAFETREQSIVTQRGGFQRGDVVVGDLHLSDFGTGGTGGPALPGGLDFVLQWTGGPQKTLNDLNLAVFSPLSTAAAPDYVANPPFTVSLTPNSPASKQLRTTTYPESSRSGGRISANSVGPDGLELAYWPKTYPTGNYQVRVYDLVDALNPPAATVDPVPYTVDVYRGGTHLATYHSTIGQLQTSPTIVVPVAASTAAPVATATARAKGRAAGGGGRGAGGGRGRAAG